MKRNTDYHHIDKRLDGLMRVGPQLQTHFKYRKCIWSTQTVFLMKKEKKKIICLKNISLTSLPRSVKVIKNNGVSSVESICNSILFDSS